MMEKSLHEDKCLNRDRIQCCEHLPCSNQKYRWFHKVQMPPEALVELTASPSQFFHIFLLS
jgi:hypothetical protein